RASGFPDAADAFARASAALDRYTGAWVAMRTDACVATNVRRDQSPALLDLRVRCLDRRMGEVRALTRLLARADRPVAARAAGAHDDGLVARDLGALMVALARRSKLAEALALRPALEAAIARGNLGDVGRAGAYQDLGRVHVRSGDYAAAERELRQALELRQ